MKNAYWLGHFHLLAVEPSLRIIQEMLGHENISPTQMYAHLDLSHLRSFAH